MCRNKTTIVRELPESAACIQSSRGSWEARRPVRLITYTQRYRWTHRSLARLLVRTSLFERSQKHVEPGVDARRGLDAQNLVDSRSRRDRHVERTVTEPAFASR